ncbi:unnamed protein product [Dibothriocephalus latus]|uniref:Protein canopy homolog 3 n=1 Tax=Dibothriocephalus latus TaxID=60516 RepID=A0A3P7MTR4_DIBLA|nr:unnamed protein product [Dibothriocephalus latus]
MSEGNLCLKFRSLVTESQTLVFSAKVLMVDLVLISAIIAFGGNFCEASLKAVTEEDAYGVKPPTACEVCKIVAIEFIDRFKETSSFGVIDIDYGTEDRRQLPYATSELRLIEILQEPSLCDRMLKYRVHKERTDSTRFEKRVPQTFEVLKELIGRGVEVKTDVPHELWDSPSAEITLLQKSCQILLEEYEGVIEDWFYNHQVDEPFATFLCANHVLKGLPSGKLCFYCSISKN